jgi:hypothetical protein
MDILVRGTNGPAPTSFRPSSWGDYITIRPFNGEGPGWVGSGWTLEGGPSASNVVPRYFEFTLQNENGTSPTTVEPASATVASQEQFGISSANFFFGQMMSGLNQSEPKELSAHDEIPQNMSSNNGNQSSINTTTGARIFE